MSPIACLSISDGVASGAFRSVAASVLDMSIPFRCIRRMQEGRISLRANTWHERNHRRTEGSGTQGHVMSDLGVSMAKPRLSVLLRVVVNNCLLLYSSTRSGLPGIRVLLGAFCQRPTRLIQPPGSELPIAHSIRLGLQPNSAGSGYCPCWYSLR